MTNEVKSTENGTLPLTQHKSLQRWSDTVSPLVDDPEDSHTPPKSTVITATDIITAATTPRKSNETTSDPLAILDAEVDGTRDKEREQAEQARRTALATSSTPAPQSLFPVNPDLNRRIILWLGDICTLDTDVIVNTTNERMNDYGGISGRIFGNAGPTLAQECATLSEGCPTGDAVILGAGNLHAKNVILTVGPRYSVKYQTAAENALHGCYRRSLELLKDAGLTSIAFCVVNTERKGYPRVPAAHIACRTIRRFLQLFGDGVDTIVLCMDTQPDYDIYEEVLPLYFPRTRKEQQYASSVLPQDTGNELGETVIEERKIRISTMPGLGNTPIITTSSSDVGPTIITDLSPRTQARALTPNKPKKSNSIPSSKRNSIRPPIAILQPEHDFSDMQENPDDIRAKQDAERPRAEQIIEEQNREYAAYLRRAKEEDLKDMAARNFCYLAGQDGEGRPIVCLVGRNFPGEPEHLERALLYLILTLDPVVVHNYNLIYFHAGIEAQNKPPMKWLKLVYGIFNRKYKKNLKRLFIVHPSIWVKMVIWFVSPFVKKKFWKKLQYAPKLMDLYEFFDAKQLRVPAEITKHDVDIHGAHYIENYESEKLASKKEDDTL